MKLASLAISLLSAAAMHNGAVRAELAEEIAAPFVPTSGSRENAVKRNDGSAMTVDGALGAPIGGTAFAAPRSDGMPIYGATPALPQVAPSTWGSYRPSHRPSQQIEHVTRIITAGYLR